MNTRPAHKHYEIHVKRVLQNNIKSHGMLFHNQILRRFIDKIINFRQSGENVSVSFNPEIIFVFAYREFLIWVIHLFIAYECMAWHRGGHLWDINTWLSNRKFQLLQWRYTHRQKTDKHMTNIMEIFDETELMTLSSIWTWTLWHKVLSYRFFNLSHIIVTIWGLKIVIRFQMRTRQEPVAQHYM